MIKFIYFLVGVIVTAALAFYTPPSYIPIQQIMTEKYDMLHVDYNEQRIRAEKLDTTFTSPYEMVAFITRATMSNVDTVVAYTTTDIFFLSGTRVQSDNEIDTVFDSRREALDYFEQMTANGGSPTAIADWLQWATENGYVYIQVLDGEAGIVYNGPNWAIEPTEDITFRMVNMDYKEKLCSADMCTCWTEYYINN